MPSDKTRILNKIKWEIENIHNVPWSEMERKMQSFLNAAYDDNLLPKMSPDDLIDAGFCRKEFKTGWSLQDVDPSEEVKVQTLVS